jgi:HSP20 family protein
MEVIMRDIEKRNGERSLYSPLRDFLDFESFLPTDLLRSTKNMLPAVNISEDRKNYNVEVVAPGFRKEDFKVDVADDILTISAESKHEASEEDKGKQYSRREYSHSSFTRSFQLPEDIKDDNIEANYSDGVLKLSIPKSEQKIKQRKSIQIG